MQKDDAVKLSPSIAATVLREAIEQKQAAQPPAITGPVRVGGEWLRQYSAGELALEPSIAAERQTNK